MTSRSVQAWVIHKQWSGDTSARVSFFTRELGLIQCLCKGGRTPKKQSLLQAFTPLWVSVDERHERYYAQTIESIAPMFHLEGVSLFSGLYVNELLYYALSPASADEELFNAYLTTLNGLALNLDRLTVEPLLRRFEWALLKNCGYSFSFTQEARTGDWIAPDHYYHFVAGEGFIVANKGIPGEHLLALSEDDLSDESFLKSAKLIMRQAIEHLLGGREIQARSLF